MKKNKNFIPILLAVLLVASAVAAYNSRYALDLSTSSSKKINNSGSVWEVLKDKGLQGEHFTLNIHGKKSDFNKQDCNASGDELGNNIFIPSNSGELNVDNQILMMSGNAKGKWAETNTTYGVTDSCTNAFDGDAAELKLPANDKGYFVTARVLGKPTNDPSFEIAGDLVWVNDESGNDLLVLGLVTDNGFETPSMSLTRTKGKVKAVDITGVFEWNGDVCYFETENYCYDDLGNYTCSDQDMCCTVDDTGLYNNCSAALIDADGLSYCAEGYELRTVGCQTYNNEWVFNIGDFVGYMWDTYTDGDFKLANIRFYPVK